MTVGVANVERAEIAGMPVFLAEAAGQARAGLMFGVGSADQPLWVRGITHLCEHLVLSDMPRGDHSFNGGVGWNSTSFVASGARADVAGFLNDLFPRLGTIPVARLEKERDLPRRVRRPGDDRPRPTSAGPIRGPLVRPNVLRRVRARPRHG